MTVTEGDSVTLTIHRDGSTDSQVSVKVRTVDGTAIARALDYVTMKMEEIVFSIGQMEQSITVSTLEDDIPETNEVFYLELYDPQGNILQFTQSYRPQFCL